MSTYHALAFILFVSFMDSKCSWIYNYNGISGYNPSETDTLDNRVSDSRGNEEIAEVESVSCDLVANSLGG
ncbi:hypothetical protein M514_02766 [Trichuris suis]|uniref:Uncharacterized protein n=1 Tax=Trichuris suis TaxID=68888 RepID=A0A085MGG5_9BILA|nr:hypothetical protein M513_02766 [Trichuris suis]KFD68758.1 hypothetical protein M514_02766 [Trichuris suis]